MHFPTLSIKEIGIEILGAVFDLFDDSELAVDKLLSAPKIFTYTLYSSR